jgi:hypothetical protein
MFARYEVLARLAVQMADTSKPTECPPGSAVTLTNIDCAGVSGVFFSNPNVHASIDPEDCSAEKHGI